jgi:hypothetical protein
MEEKIHQASKDNEFLIIILQNSKKYRTERDISPLGKGEGIKSRPYTET